MTRITPAASWVAVPLLLAAGVPGPAQAGGQPSDARAAPAVSLLTFAPGEVYWQRFGHNALLIRDAAGARVYNYGIFDFEQENFFLNFARGEMRYRLEVEPLWSTLPRYRDEGRWVLEQRLDLDPAQATALSDFLEWNAQPENAEYPYDYFRDNCSTRLRDALDRALNGELRRQLEPQLTPFSFRHEAMRMMSPLTALALGIDWIIGPATEPALNRWQQGFLPEVLMQSLRQVKQPSADGQARALVRAEARLLPGVNAAPPEHPPAWTGRFAFAGILCALVLLALARAAARFAFAGAAVLLALAAGLGGVVLLCGWTLTAHWVIRANQNLLLFSPLCLLLLPAWAGSARVPWRPPRRQQGLALAVAFVAALAPALKLLPVAQQSNTAWIALMLPIHFALAFSICFPASRRKPEKTRERKREPCAKR